MDKNQIVFSCIELVGVLANGSMMTTKGNGDLKRESPLWKNNYGRIFMEEKW